MNQTNFVAEPHPATNAISPSRRFTMSITILATIALGVSGYLAYSALTSSSVAGCSGGFFDCGSVLNSRWARWFGIPVSLLASVTYVSLLVSLRIAQHGSRWWRSLGWQAVMTMGMAAGFAAIWFLFLQFVVLEHLCLYCLIAHGCGLLIAIMTFSILPKNLRATGAMGSLAMIGLCVLVFGQVVGPTPKTYTIENYEEQSVSTPVESPTEELPGEELDIFSAPTEDEVTTDETIFLPPTDDSSRNHQLGRVPWLALPAISLSSALVFQEEETSQEETSQESEPQPAKNNDKVAPKVRRLACISNGSIKLDVTQWPLVGDPQAKFVFVEIFDYACPHCRKTHQQAIKGAQAQLRGELAVLALPLPLNINCNSAIKNTGPLFGESCEIAKLAIAVWRVDPSKFADFHNWMFIGDSSPTYAMAKKYAEQLVDKGQLAKEFASPLVAAYIQKHVKIYEMTGNGNVPKLMFPKTSVIGEFTSTDLLVDIVKKQGLVLTQ